MSLVVVKEYFEGRVLLVHGDAYALIGTVGQSFGKPNMVADPPYEIKTKGGGKFQNARRTMRDLEAMDLTKGFDLSILSWGNANSIVTFCSNEQLVPVITRLQEGFRRVVLCSWHKTNPMPLANKHYQATTEYFIHAWNEGHHPRGTLADKKRYIITPVISSKIKKSLGNHPSIKPEAVMDKILTNIDGPVLDPFMGTCSTGVAAIRQGKKFIGIEQTQKFYEVACQRMAALETELGAGYRLS